MSTHRILHVINSLSPADGGPPEGVRQLTANYLALGMEVEVATTDDPAASFLRGLPFPVHGLGPRLNKYGRSPRMKAWLDTNTSRFDLVVINGLFHFHGVAAARAARKVGVPYVVFTHGALDGWFKRRYPVKHLKKMLYWPIQYGILRGAQHVLFTSEGERKASAGTFWPSKWNGLVVPYGTNEPAGKLAVHLKAFYDRVPEIHGKRFLLFLSRIHEKKGIDLLLTAFQGVAADNPDLYLVVAGPDQVGLQVKLQQQAEDAGIQDQVLWLGMLKGDAKYGALCAAEAFVLPSHQENFGIAVAEALACGTPVLISNKVNIYQEIIDSGVGLVCDDTAEGVQDMLRLWLSTPASLKKAMKSNAVATFERHYSMRHTAVAIASQLGGATKPVVRTFNAVSISVTR